MTNSDLFTSASSERNNVLSVSELNRRTRNLLEAHLELLWVAGEVSNFTRAASGHWYFSLKDENAQVRCVMFRNKAALLGFIPENGMQLEACALPSLYEPRGEFQLGVETLRRAGLGALYEAFERLKTKLAREGMFEEARKKTLPTLPRGIGIVTSTQAAALHDVLTTLRRRAPMIEVILYPASVQGAGAAREIAAAIKAAGARSECDALIVCRGGGSIEDLWPFNEESVARAIAACPLPVVCGIGHETDITIADFVADRRAPTPTAAAEMLSPDRPELLASLTSRGNVLKRLLQRALEQLAQRLDHARRGLLSPAQRLARAREQIAALKAGLARGMNSAMQQRQWRLAHAGQALRAQCPDIAQYAAQLQFARTSLVQARARRFDQLAHHLQQARSALKLLNPQRILERGYSIAETTHGEVVRDVQQAPAGASLHLRFARGRVAATVDRLLDDNPSRNTDEPGV